MKLLVTALFMAAIVISASAQSKETGDQKMPADGGKAEVKIANPAIELADAALKAHGGDKLRNMKTLTITGTVDITPSNISQAVPATFVTIFAGDKYRFELNNPFQPIKQIYDGVETYSNVQNGFRLPPANRLGFPLIPKIGDTDFPVSTLPDDKEGKLGFRITSPEGFYTDFYIDKKTGQIKKYESSYSVNGGIATTSVEIDKFREVDGLLIPERYAQRFDLGQLTIYAEFKAKEIIVNKELADDIFVMK